MALARIYVMLRTVAAHAADQLPPVADRLQEVYDVGAARGVLFADAPDRNRRGRRVFRMHDHLSVGPRSVDGCGAPQPAGLDIPYEAICRAVGGLAKLPSLAPCALTSSGATTHPLMMTSTAKAKRFSMVVQYGRGGVCLQSM